MPLLALFVENEMNRRSFLKAVACLPVVGAGAVLCGDERASEATGNSVKEKVLCCSFEELQLCARVGDLWRNLRSDELMLVKGVCPVEFVRAYANSPLTEMLYTQDKMVFWGSVDARFI